MEFLGLKEIRNSLKSNKIMSYIKIKQNKTIKIIRFIKQRFSLNHYIRNLKSTLPTNKKLVSSQFQIPPNEVKI